jgi:hypothetical protein
MTIGLDSIPRTAANAGALEICQAVAAGTFTAPLPVVLQGPPGSGKTMLLQALARSLNGNCTVSYADSPVELYQCADAAADESHVLLLDGDDLLADAGGSVEVLVSQYLEAGHPVLLALSTPPAEISGLSDAFQSVLKNGTTIPLEEPPEEPTEEESAEEPVDEEPPEESAEEESAAPSSSRGTTARMLQQRLEEMRHDFTALRAERDQLSSEVSNQDKQKEAAGLLRQELDESFAEHALLQGQLAARKMDGEELETLKAERDAARREADAVRARGQDLLKHVGELRAALAAQSKAAQEQVSRFIAASKQDPGEASGKPPATGDWAAIHAEKERLEGLVEDTRGVQGRLRTENAALKGRENALKEELRKAHKQVSLRTAEMDALRQAAVKQVSTAQAQSSELEQRVRDLETALEATQAKDDAFKLDAARIGSELAEAAQALHLLAAQHGDKSKKDKDDDIDIPLFDVSPFGGPSVDFDARRPIPPIPATMDVCLRDTIEEALRDTPKPQPPES